MKKSTSTFLKHPTKDNVNRSANPPVTRASTILFKTMQEMYQHELKIKKHKKITHYTYGSCLLYTSTLPTIREV